MRVRTLAAALAAVVLVAGCGGSSSPSTSTTTAKKPTATKKSAATTATTVPVSSKPSSSGTPTFASDANCLQLSGLGTKFAEAMGAATGSKFNETAAAADFQKMADAAPSAIRPDLETIATAFTKFAEAMKSSGFVIGKTPTAAQEASLAQAVTVFEGSKLKSAEAALQAWGSKNCS